MEVVGVAMCLDVQAIIVRPAHMSLGRVKVVQIFMRTTIAITQILMMEAVPLQRVLQKLQRILQKLQRILQKLQRRLPQHVLKFLFKNNFVILLKVLIAMVTVAKVIFVKNLIILKITLMEMVTVIVSHIPPKVMIHSS